MKVMKNIKLQQKELFAKDQMKGLFKDSKVKVKYLGNKKALIVSPIEIDLDIQIVLSKFEKEPVVGSTFDAVIAQISKDGKVTQLKKL